MALNPETLRLYADIFAMPRRVDRSSELIPPSEPCLAAARALRYMADQIELQPEKWPR